MLEVKNLTKIYSTKGGDVKAVDDVSVSFASTGLVFLLGKSGSGKSTLLNLIGGLDEPTSGEVIVYGKSSKDFSGGDFDSYRNTYVGFIFQEYNILNEFNVEDNIAIALELQGKRKNKQTIQKILDEVELGEYAQRKPNTLSGGQKQRVAIARALVKDPQIIMADEPTGALDSNTGKQVFETLKRLSKTRLVLVVSHDRDFAVTYGDRIIELQDGKIISDVSKIRQASEYFAPSVTRLGDTITVKNGKQLDEKTIKSIAEFISSCDGEVIISGAAEEIDSFKRANKIDAEGRRESFSTTFVTPPREERNVKFIRSKLPASKAIRIGASGLKLKPFRLVLTILLSLVSFMMFGIFSTLMLYNERTVMIKSFMGSDYTYTCLQKQYKVEIRDNDESTYTQYAVAKFTGDEVKSFDPNAFGVVNGRASISMFTNVTMAVKYSAYYKFGVERLAYLEEGNPLRESIYGKYPQSANEIVISSYLVDCLMHAEYKDFSSGRLGEVIEINSKDDIIGKYLSIQNVAFKVVGVFDSGIIPAKYDKYKEIDEYNGGIVEEYLFRAFLSEGLFQLVLVSQSLFETFKDVDQGMLGDSFWFYDELTIHGDTKYVEEEDAVFDNVLIPFAHDEKQFGSLLDRLNKTNSENDVRYVMASSLYEEVQHVNVVADSLSELFLWIGVVLALFASLMLFNFISLSITSKKKEIGILRAVGARGVDVFKIFFAESAIIVAICMLLSVIGTALLTVYLNFYIKAETGLSVTLFLFGPLPILCMLSIAAVVTFISTFLPVYLAARKKPVDSIRAM